ncbi:Uncharacterised protein [Mycobacteroides abscessus subsp. abscessus]|nr:Uncharacterised protein [Mycobacteroides abscessus subsp. abscessus]
MRAVPGSMTYRMPGTVSEVSATLVASTTRLPVCDAKTLCCSAVGSRAYSGRTSVPARTISLSASDVSRISRSPDRNTRMSPGGSFCSSRTASAMASVWSRSSVRTIS